MVIDLSKVVRRLYEQRKSEGKLESFVFLGTHNDLAVNGDYKK